jgi:8-oxo-dGTP diphosphatase
MIRVVAAIIEHGGRLLICQRRAGDVFALKWEFPGGKMRPSETPRAALARELREELGIEAAINRELYRVHHRYREIGDGLEIMFFSTALSPATLSFSAPRNLAFERIHWSRRTDLANYDFLPADRLLIKRLVRGEFAKTTPRIRS